MLSRGRSSGLASIGLVLVVVLGVWLADGRDPGSSNGQGTPRPSSAVTYPGRTDPLSGLPLVDLDTLPPAAAQTVRTIDHGGPYPFADDGSTFVDHAHVLPDEPHGYYTEFGVAGSSQETVLVGEGGELYWTGDGGATFQRIQR